MLLRQKKARKPGSLCYLQKAESTIITVSENTGSGSSRRHTTRRTYSEINTFFSEDLSHLLQKSVSSNFLDEGIIEILPQNKEIAFEFELPSHENLFSSYKGRHANITQLALSNFKPDYYDFMLIDIKMPRIM